MELTRKLETLLRSLYTRHGRRKSGYCVCEGVRAVGELFARRPELVRFTVATERGLAEYGPVSGDLYSLSESRFAEFAGTVNSQGILAVAAIPAPPGEETPPEVPFIFALDGLGDPGNFGTICRTLRSTGLDELWYTKGSIDPYGDKAIRSGLGVQFALKLRCFENLETLRAAAAKFGISKSTVHKDISERLPHFNRTLYLQVKEVLDVNKAQRHIRGGIATRKKYRGA